MTKVYNYRHRQTTCPDCHTDKDILIDPVHAIVYCEHCGLVLQDTHIPTVYDEIEEQYMNEKRIRNLWKRRFNVMENYHKNGGSLG